MTSHMRETEPRAEHVCPVCRRTVHNEIKRHKTLGVFVPLWGPGPCHNPDCTEYEPPRRRPRPRP
ncbi:MULTISPECIES: hypothetical protein [Streptomyces]|uniref:hypothetical protein n=1 Tax=Streptomyces TaxID=1883 RepID=UPI000D50AD47|nr:hypothetical protein [Streptomyces sp. CS081A]PVC69714.1 hypothetical protein DBP18_22980 [Streptomyces sp. CS081A]